MSEQAGLPEPENVVVPGGRVADVQGYVEVHDLMQLSLREEPIGDAALIEDLDGARVQTACARAGEVLAGAPLDNGDVDARQRQLARQHQPGRTASGDHHRMVGHRHVSRLRGGDQPGRARTVRRQQCTHLVTPQVGFGRRIYGMRRVLKQAPCALHIKVGDGYSAFRLGDGCLSEVARVWMGK